MINGEVERVTHALSALCEPLHEVFTWADVMRRERLRELAGNDDYRWLRAHVTRAYSHYRLSERTDLGPWRLTGKHTQNGALWLSDSRYRIRILHALDSQRVPPPGRNRQRRAFYWNPPLPIPELADCPNDRLLMLWTIDGTSHVPIFRVVRPIGNWRFGERAKKDLDFILPETAADLESLHFEPTDEDLDFEIPNEEEGTGDVGGVTG